MRLEAELREIRRMEEAKRRVDWSYKLADRARMTIRNAFNKYLYIKARYRNNLETFKYICFEMSGTKILASLREFKNIVKLLVTDKLAWGLIPSGERDLIVRAAKLAGVMVCMPVWTLLS